MLKVVIDTNLLVASLFNRRSFSHRIIKQAREGKIKLLWTSAIRKEAEFILGNISRSARRENLDLDRIFKPQNKISKAPKVKIIKEDPEDDKFLACALAGEVDIIISSDKHLLNLGNFKNIPIKNTKEAKKFLEKRRG